MDIVKAGEEQSLELTKKPALLVSSVRLGIVSEDNLFTSVEYFDGNRWIWFNLTKKEGDNYYYYTNDFKINDFNKLRFKPHHRDLTMSGIYEFNISVLNKDTLISYLELDPYVNITGCTSDATTVYCEDGNFTGNYIYDGKNVVVDNATIDDSTNYLLHINNTGWVKIRAKRKF